jgi:hypothetical protein
MAILCDIEHSVSFVLDDTHFYLTLRWGIVAFQGANVSILDSREGLEEFFVQHVGRPREIDEVVLDMMWTMLKSARTKGLEETKNDFLKFLEENGWQPGPSA